MPLDPQIIQRTRSTQHGAAALRVCETLTDAGFDTWWVGGAVRDMLLGVVPKDIDVATEATPDRIAGLFKRADMKGAAFGSVHVKVGTQTVEVTTFREDDAASDGRHPESVRFGGRDADAKRRDFTVNALYWNPVTGELFDPCDGEADLRERLVRFIGDPTVRIRHDALRLLRAVRLRAAIDGQYHPETYRALQEQANQVSALSGTRKLEELEKILKLPMPSRALEDLWELRMMAGMVPELAACKGVAQPKDYHREGDVWEHLLRCTDHFEDDDGPDVRLAALLHDIGKPETFALKERIRFDEHAPVSAQIADAILSRLQCPKRRRDKIHWLIAHHMMMQTFFEISEERKGHWYFHPWFDALLRVFRLDIAGTDPSDYGLYDRIVADFNAFLDRHPRPEKPLLSGAEVMRILGIPPGERVGAVLADLRAAQERGEVMTKQDARSFIDGRRGSTTEGT